MTVDIVATAYDERPLAHLTPQDLARTHARGKAAGAQADVLIVAADTVVDLDGEALGKPRDRADARAMIARLSGREHLVHTAFALRDPATGKGAEGMETTAVRFATLDEALLDAYAASGDGLDKAGAYGIQGFAATLVERIAGDYFTVVGFPLARFAATLPQLGYRLFPQPAGTFA